MEISDSNYASVLSELIGQEWKDVKRTAEQAGIDCETMRRWLRGETCPSLPCLVWVLDALGYKLEVVKK